MSFALLGVMAVQFYFLKESYSLKSQLFDQAVNDALKNVSFKLEKNEAASFLARKARAEREAREIEREKKLQLAKEVQRKKQRSVKEDPTLAFIRKLKADQAKSDSIFRVRDSMLRNRYPNMLVYNGPVEAEPSERIKGISYNYEEVIDEFGNVKQNISQQVYTEKNPIRKSRLKSRVVIDSIKQYVVVDPVRGPIIQTIGKPNYLSQVSPRQLAAANAAEASAKLQAKNVKSYLDSLENNADRKKLLDDIAAEFQQVNIPLHQRIKRHLLDSLLLTELTNNGIFLDFNYKISAENNRLVYMQTSTNNPEFKNINTYKTALFPKDMFRESGFLYVNFPNKSSVILQNMNSMMFSSMALLLIMLGSFAYTIHSILKQKKVSEMKTDFINNMTHEFNTPVATIMIASEALKDPEVNEDKKRVNKLAGIIYDENVRLGDHIERVLNVAKIEKNDLKLDNSAVDMNDLISAVADTMSLQLQKRSGVLELHLDADKSAILGDELHLSNIIFNLLDNAIKYSKEAPEIAISTHNRSGELFVTVKDKGIGMSRDQQKKIFEQFYRIPTGNLHDVKGFGLGLSYVSSMVKRMNGSISVKSEKDKGSEFEIRFPLMQKAIYN